MCLAFGPSLFPCRPFNAHQYKGLGKGVEGYWFHISIEIFAPELRLTCYSYVYRL